MTRISFACRLYGVIMQTSSFGYCLMNDSISDVQTTASA